MWATKDPNPYPIFKLELLHSFSKTYLLWNIRKTISEGKGVMRQDVLAGRKAVLNVHPETLMHPPPPAPSKHPESP